jgi:multidrug efflux pump subunit AcrA (membrane-fusion protein)
MSVSVSTGDPVATAARLAELREAVAEANMEAASALQRLSQSQVEGHRDPEALASYTHADAVMSAAEREAASLLALHHVHLALEGRLATALEQASLALLALGSEVRASSEIEGRREAARARLSPLLGVVGAPGSESEASFLRDLATPPETPDDLPAWLDATPALIAVLEHLEGMPLPVDSYADVARASSNSVLGALLAGALYLS